MTAIQFGLQIGIAALAGLVIGLERELRGKSAGLKTNALVATGACVFLLISFEFKGLPYVDATRVLGQIVTGIGFIGAGTILHHKSSIKGLTTAATVWCSAAAGCLAGLQLYWELVILGVLILTINYGLSFLEKKLPK
ncbi:MgtC/SapB family protein [Gillisia sp. M10.2A]|uniref:MgtC/SapB family protein n=1 Tax=Gillisia lutea TaxID=2909668 RepID=A0ABS9EDX1_9FLAO|nr:MgtC/SapB family protein [Gillisia lutea]MCF4100462.1 MgtC/SapB family protein [Gillisia lutea]